MEALRTQNNNLQWEVNRLDTENRRLRSEYPDLGARLDLEAELEPSLSRLRAMSPHSASKLRRTRHKWRSCRGRRGLKDNWAVDVGELERIRTD